MTEKLNEVFADISLHSVGSSTTCDILDDNKLNLYMSEMVEQDIAYDNLNICTEKVIWRKAKITEFSNI